MFTSRSSTTKSFAVLVVAGFLPTTLLLAPAAPARAQQAAAVAATPVMLVRPGDSAMTCEALAGEINTLAQTDAAPASAPAVKPRRHGLDFLRIVGSAVPMVGLVGGAGSALLSSAAGAASVAAQPQPSDKTDAVQRYAATALAGPSVAQQRKERLAAMFEQKHC